MSGRPRCDTTWERFGNTIVPVSKKPVSHSFSHSPGCHYSPDQSTVECFWWRDRLTISVLDLRDIVHSQDTSDCDPHRIECHEATRTYSATKAKSSYLGILNVGIEGAIFHEASGIECEWIGVDIFIMKHCPMCIDYNIRHCWSMMSITDQIFPITSEPFGKK